MCMALDSELSMYAYTFDGTLAGEFTSAVSNLEIEHIEGPYRASWRFEEGDGVSRQALRAWFYNRLMYRIVIAYKGVEVWSGYVWEMELEMGRLVLKRSMTDMGNAITCTHMQDNDFGFIDLQYSESLLPDGVVMDSADSAWALVTESITQYGRQERVLNSNGSDGEALELALVSLETLPDPYSYQVIYRPLDSASLQITAVGRMTIANKFYLVASKLRSHPDYADMSWEDTIRNGVAWTVGDEMKRIVDVINRNAGWLYPIKIATNDTETKAGVSSTVGTFDRMVELAKLRNSDGERYQLTILNDGGVIYDKYDETPQYVLRTPDQGVRFYDGTVPKWDAKPGVIKDIAGSAGLKLPTSWLSDQTLIPVERTTMREGDEFASFHSRTVDPIELQVALYANLREVKQLEE
jgi:hypothetical protein